NRNADDRAIRGLGLDTFGSGIGGGFVVAAGVGGESALAECAMAGVRARGRSDAGIGVAGGWDARRATGGVSAVFYAHRAGVADGDPRAGHVDADAVERRDRGRSALAAGQNRGGA